MSVLTRVGGRHGRALRHGWAVLTCWRGTVEFGGGTVVLPSTGGLCRFAVRPCAQDTVGCFEGVLCLGVWKLWPRRVANSSDTT